MNETGGVAIRDAASLILVRRDGPEPRVLMGQRGAGAVFMPDKFVFPGGALDPGDLAMARGADLDPMTARRLAVQSDADIARALPMTAVRELWEETGLRLGRVGTGAGPCDVPSVWSRFFEGGVVPATRGLRLVFRAVTPPGRTRRFDARFFLAEATDLVGDGSDFTGADAELSNLCWTGIAAARDLPLAFITTVVLGEIEALLKAPGTPRPAPFFRHDDVGSQIALL